MALSKHFKRSYLVQKIFELNAWVKKCHFGNFSEHWASYKPFLPLWTWGSNFHSNSLHCVYEDENTEINNKAFETGCKDLSA